MRTARWRGGQVLQRGDEGQAQRLLRLRELGRIAVAGLRQHVGVGDRLQPRDLGQRVQRAVGRADLGELHRPGAALAAVEHVHADVRGDPVQPGLQRRAALEAVDAAPRAQHRLLHGVLGLEGRAEHPVAVAGQLAAVLLEPLLEVAGDARVAGWVVMRAW